MRYMAVYALDIINADPPTNPAKVRRFCEKCSAHFRAKPWPDPTRGKNCVKCPKCKQVQEID